MKIGFFAEWDESAGAEYVVGDDVVYKVFVGENIVYEGSNAFNAELELQKALKLITDRRIEDDELA